MSLANTFLVINKWKQIPKKRSTVIQKYISNPYLINSKKFDIRIYALVTSFHPLKIYIYRGGHARFATAKYSQNFHNVSNRFMHVTSSAVNRHNKLYFVDQSSELYEGNNWPLSLLWRYLKDKNHDTNELWRLIEEIVIKTIICAEDHIIGSASNLPSRYNGYELFGLDIILDEKLKPWLLEVNMTPSLKYVSISGLSTIRYLIKNMLNIVGYHFPPTTFKFLKNAMNENIKLETPVFDRRLYSTMLSTEEKLKQNLFKRMRSSVQNVSKILENLTPDDVRYLIQAEDELSQCSVFSRIFPTASTNKYLKFLEGPRYYDILLDAWERKYFCNRARGIRRLQKLCNKKFHL